ncbi:MAG: discoidin domain-containing protein [Prolixibacteraceae bacterium]|jgi:hypothetical protein
MTFRKSTFLFLKILLLLLMGTGLSYSYAQTKVSLDSSSRFVLWKVKPQVEVGSDSLNVFKPGYGTGDWVNAVVPGTVFSSYVEAGLEKDPNYGDNIYQVDKSKYDRSFWYRTEFEIPGSFRQEKIWLNFEGINRLGEVFLNGKHLATLSGMMQRGKFDITPLARRNEKNVLAVLVSIPKMPLNNYGSPTYLSSAGWDWMPYVPGLNSGITDDVYLINTGPMVIEDPWIRTALPSNAQAYLSVKVNIENTSSEHKQAELSGIIQPGDISFTRWVSLDAGRTTEVSFDREQFPQLVVHNPKLWWPNGYGEPNLYTCKFKVKMGDQVSDSKTIKFGIKQYSYDTNGGDLHVWINGKRVFLKGGNWGMSEYMLRCRGDEYDTKVRFHKELNFNVIRNWLGSTTDEEFYEACDKYGIMVWDDFWLNANPNLPSDINAFNSNAVEKIKRVRNHPSVAIWCGDNEGFPQPPLSGWLRENIKTFDGNDRYYQSCSNTGNLTGSGLWGNHSPEFYFTKYPLPYQGTGDPEPGWGLRSEIGTAVFPNVASFKKFIPEKDWWPQNEMWDKHFFGPKAFNATPDKYNQTMNQLYGKPDNIGDYCRKAQLLNLEVNKAMYEGWLAHMWDDASGVMIWMSQSAYPSMVWQTYDYYYDLTGAYFGAKSACEPVHILWNPVDNSVDVCNTSAQDVHNLTAEISVFNSNGEEVEKFHQSTQLTSLSNTVAQAFVIPFYANQSDLALSKKVVASSGGGSQSMNVTDGDKSSRWSSDYSDNQWIYVDLGKTTNVNRVVLNWENAYGKEYKIQVTSDELNWTDVAEEKQGKAGPATFVFDNVAARYVRMLGVERGTSWGYSLYDFKVYGASSDNNGLSDVHFIKLQLKDRKGNVISDNRYWRGIKRNDFTALNSLPKVKLKVKSKVAWKDGKCYVNATITNPASSPAVAFAVWVQAINSQTKEQILPAVVSDNYFTLMKGESKEIQVEFDASILAKGEEPLLTIEPYNNAEH